MNIDECRAIFYRHRSKVCCPIYMILVHEFAVFAFLAFYLPFRISMCVTCL